MSSLSNKSEQSLATSLAVSLGRKVVLPYRTITFARAGSEYLRYGGVITKQPNANQPATRNIGGRVFMQSEGASATVSTYSEDLSNWNLTRVDVSSNAVTSPIGDMTSDKAIPDTNNNTHIFNQTFSADGSSRYVASGYFQQGGYKIFSMAFSSALFVGSPLFSMNCDTGAILDSTNLDFYGVDQIGDYWYWYMAATSDAAGSSLFQFVLQDNLGASSFAGDGTSGIYVWGMDCVKSDILTSYMYADGATGSKNKTQGHWTITEVPADHWMRSRFYFELIAHHYDSVMAAAIGSGSYYLFDFDATAENITCYLDFADNKIKWAGSVTGALGETDALTWSLEDKAKLWFTFDNGSNSTLRVDGWGVDTTYTGTSCAAADGSVYWTMDSSEANHNHALQSEPEKF